jgi:hypothetical protein
MSEYLTVYLEDCAWLVKVSQMFMDIDAHISLLKTKADALI